MLDRTNEFMPLAMAADRLGCSTRTLRRRLTAMGADVFADPRDHRARLIRTDDFAGIDRPMLCEGRRVRMPASAGERKGGVE